VIQLKY